MSLFYKYILAFFILILIASVNSYGQQKTVTAVYIAKFSGDRSAAICYAFDDGLKDQYDIAVPLLNKFGFRGTFFVIPANVVENDSQLLHRKAGAWGGISWSKLNEMAKEGHEIASHSWSHKNMKNLSDAALQQEINKADSMITKKIGVAPLTFAYPYNAFNERVHNAVLKNHIAAREFQFGIGSRFTTVAGNSWADGLIKNKTWGITMIHGISVGFDSLSSPKVLEDHLQYVKQLTGKIWVDTFATISKYIKERDSTTLIIKQMTDQVKLTLNTPLDKKTYNQPLTIVVELKNITSVKATQNDQKIPLSMNKDNIYVEAMPGRGEVDIKWVGAKETPINKH